MRTSTALKILALLLAGIAVPGAREGLGRPAAPNLILVITDDQGYGDLSCHGNPVVKTPHIDRLHAESVRLTDFHVSPTCAPTRCSIMTGRHEFKSGVTHTIHERERMSLKAVTFVQLLKSAGYATGIFGKWHLGDEAPYQPGKRGFDEVFVHGAGGIGQTYPGSGGDAPGNTYFDPAILHNGVFEKTKGFCTDVFFSQAMKWIEERKGKAPFYAHISTNAPHAPYVCPDAYAEPFKGKVDPKIIGFYGMIANIDDNVGRLVGKLREWGIEKETLLVFMTDNGTAAGAKVHNAGMLGSKGTPHNGGTRVPCFFRWPGTLVPGDRPQLTAHLDLFPTFAELAGAAVPEDVRRNLEGFSLVPLLKDAAAPWPDRFLVTHVGRWDRGQAAAGKLRNCSIRKGPHLLVRGRAGWQLFDLKEDPGQARDLAADRPEGVKALEAIYDRWWDEALPCLENEDAPVPAVNPFKELYWKQFGGGPGKKPDPAK
jgi:arylsulfatase